MITSTGIAKSGSSSTVTAEDLMENFRVNTVGPILVSQVRKMTNYYLRVSVLTCNSVKCGIYPTQLSEQYKQQKFQENDVSVT